MERRRAARALRALLATLALGATLTLALPLRAVSADDIAAADLDWLIPAVLAVLLAGAATAMVAALARGLFEGSVTMLLQAGTAAAAVGGSAVILAGGHGITAPVCAAAGLLLAAAVADRTGILIGGRASRLGLATGLIVVGEAAALSGILPASAAVVADSAPILLAVAAAAFAIAAGVVIGRELSPPAAVLAIGAASLSLARGSDGVFLLGLGALAVAMLLLARSVLGTSDDRRAQLVAPGLPPLAQQLVDGVLLFDGRLQLRSWNPAAARLLGLDEASTGVHLEDLLGVALAQLPSVEGATARQVSLGGLELSIRRDADGITVVIHSAGSSSDAERLGRELRGTIEELLQARRTIELQRTELERAASIDPLTGVSSRSAIVDRLRVEVAQARRYQHPVAVVLADVDRFGALNAAHGIRGGDTVLREVALRVRLRVREADALGRSGSDGLLAILPHSDEGAAATFADALRRRIGQRPIWVNDAQVSVSVSVGVAVMRPGEDLDVDGLLARVDEALASARGAGGDRIALDRLHGLARLEEHRPDAKADDAAEHHA